jgi:hypothetical protein
MMDLIAKLNDSCFGSMCKAIASGEKFWAHHQMKKTILIS